MVAWLHGLGQSVMGVEEGGSMWLRRVGHLSADHETERATQERAWDKIPSKIYFQLPTLSS